MERLAIEKMESSVNLNRKLQDNVFCEIFRKEWEETTTNLKQIFEKEKARRQMAEQNKDHSISVTSSSKIFI